jgi:hypothetical protein
MSGGTEPPAWIVLAARLSNSGTALTELAGNILGSQQYGGSPRDVYRTAARQAISKAIIALDYLECAAQDPSLLQAPLKGEVYDVLRKS